MKNRTYTIIAFSILAFSIASLGQSCQENGYSLKLDSSFDLAKQQDFDRCICSRDYRNLFQKIVIQRDTIKKYATLAYYELAKSPHSCDGVYFYHMYYTYLRTGKLRGPNGPYSEYYYMIIAGDEIVIFTPQVKDRKKLYRKYKKLLFQSLGKQKVKKLKPKLLRGYVHLVLHIFLKLIPVHSFLT